MSKGSDRRVCDVCFCAEKFLFPDIHCFYGRFLLSFHLSLRHELRLLLVAINILRTRDFRWLLTRRIANTTSPRLLLNVSIVSASEHRSRLVARTGECLVVVHQGGFSNSLYQLILIWLDVWMRMRRLIDCTVRLVMCRSIYLWEGRWEQAVNVDGAPYAQDDRSHASFFLQNPGVGFSLLVSIVSTVLKKFIHM